MRPPDEGGPVDTRWLLLSMAAPEPRDAHLLVDALHRVGARSVEREEGRVVALFPPPDDPAAHAAETALAVRASTRLTDPELTWSRLTPDEWAARLAAGHPARRVTDRIVVVADVGVAPDPDVRPSPAAGPGPAGDLLIRLDPSTAFGTAEHPTTRACIRMLDDLVAPGDRVLDVGAGSAILSIAAVVLGAAGATALEVDPVSCAAARRNVALNGLEGRVVVEEVRVTGTSLEDRGRYQGVMANLHAGILQPLIPALAALPAPAGWVILSGVLREERDGIVDAARSAGLRLAGESMDEGWWTGRLERSVAPGVSMARP